MYGLLDNWLKETQGLLVQLLVIFLKKIILCQNTKSILLHASSLIIAQKIKIKQNKKTVKKEKERKQVN